MKKKTVSIAMFAMIAVAAAWNVNENRNEITLNDLTLNNVEALANGESSWGPCSYYGCIFAWNYTCDVYSLSWGSLIKSCPDMRG